MSARRDIFPKINYGAIYQLNDLGFYARPRAVDIIWLEVPQPCLGSVLRSGRASGREM